jgi:hypothetical protein
VRRLSIEISVDYYYDAPFVLFGKWHHRYFSEEVGVDECETSGRIIGKANWHANVSARSTQGGILVSNLSVPICDAIQLLRAPIDDLKC